jgi:hypothetical protein
MMEVSGMHSEPLDLADLTREVDKLRVSGLAITRLVGCPLVERIAVTSGLARRGKVDQIALRDLFIAAVGPLDNNQCRTSVAQLYGLGSGQLGLTHSRRKENAAKAARPPVGLSLRGYTGNTEKSWMHDDVELAATRLLAVYEASAPGHALFVAAGSTGRDELSLDPPAPVVAHLANCSSSDWLAQRELTCERLWRELIDERDAQLEILGSLSPNLCIFASGSFARHEANEYSDLDVFLVDEARTNTSSSSRLNRFEQAEAFTLLERCRKERGIQAYSQRGYYQQIQSFRRMLIPGAGRSKDETATLTTTRALLLANSRCFLNEPLYLEMRQRALDDYWRDGAGMPQQPLRPLFLFNDLRRVWLTMRVNFEHDFAKKPIGSRFDAWDLRRIAELKLHTVQQLGLWTPILGMLERSTDDGLLRKDAEEVLDMTTRQRLDELTESRNRTVAQAAAGVRDLYGQYLGYSWCGKDVMCERANAEDWGLVESHFKQIDRLVLSMLIAYADEKPTITTAALI